MQTNLSPLAVLLRLTLALAVGLGLASGLHAQPGFIVELCSPDGAVAIVLDGPPAADCPDCPDCLLSGPAVLAAAAALAPRALALHPLQPAWPEAPVARFSKPAQALARAPPWPVSA